VQPALSGSRDAGSAAYEQASGRVAGSIAEANPRAQGTVHMNLGSGAVVEVEQLKLARSDDENAPVGRR